jgi:hypothetical protein
MGGGPSTTDFSDGALRLLSDASRAARPTISPRRCGYDGQAGTHRFCIVLQEHCAQPLHWGCEASQMSREPHPLAVHWGARQEAPEGWGGHRSSWNTWLQTPVNGLHVSSVH